MPDSVDPRKGRREISLKARGTRTLLFGRSEIDLSRVEQLVEDGQVRAIGHAMAYLRDRYMDGRAPLRGLLRRLEQDLRREGLDMICNIPYPSDLVGFRMQDLAAALGRLRTLRVKTRSDRA